MQKLMYRQRGAISIFLAIILIPMMMIASAYIDASRVKLAQSVAESAGDLTLNTALTNYDNVLKDMYGLFAISQTEDELMDNLEDYYRKSLVSSGLTAEDANTYVGKIMSQLGMVADSGDVSDMLRIELVDDQDIVSTDETTSLANPYILKRQIVEFMKYRFGIGVGMGFINSLKSFESLSEQMDVIDKRTGYYEEQKTVVEQCETVWKNIVGYNKLGTGVPYFEGLKKELQTAEENYKYITENYIKDYYNASDRPSNTKNYFTEESTVVIKKVSESEYQLILDGTQYTNFGTYTETSPATEEQMNQYVSDLCTSTDKYKDKRNSQEYSEIFEGNGTGIYEVQRVIQFNRLAEKEDNICKDIKNLYIAYNRLVTGKKSIDTSIGYYNEQIRLLNEDIANNNKKISDNNRIIAVDDIMINLGEANSNLYKKCLELIDTANLTVTQIESQYNQYVSQLKKTLNAVNMKAFSEELEKKSDGKVIKLIDKVKSAVGNTTVRNELVQRKSTIDTELEKTKTDKTNREAENIGYQKKITEDNEKITEYQGIVEELTKRLDTKRTYYGTQMSYSEIINNQTDGYNKKCREYAEQITRLISTINQTGVTKTFINGTSTTQSNKEWVAGTLSDNEISRISGVITGYRNTLVDASSKLKTASDTLGDIIKSLSPGGELYKARTTWEKSAGNNAIEGTAISDQNLEEAETVKDFMEASEVQELKTRVDGTKATIDTILGELESYKYADGNLYSITDINKLVETINSCASKFDLINIKLKEKDLNNTVSEVYKAYMKYPSQIMSKPWEGEKADWINSVNPVMETGGGECKFYQYLKKNFPDIEVSGAETLKEGENNEDVKNTEKKLEESEESAKNKEIPKGSAKVKFETVVKDDAGKSILPSKYWKETLYKKVAALNANASSGGNEIESVDPEADDFISKLSSLFKDIGAMITDFAVDFRDNIYISDYILNMFSYDTYEKEITYEINKESGKVKNPSLSSVLKSLGGGDLYKEGDEYYSFIGTDANCGNADKYQSLAKTLTNVSITPNNNAAYLSEVEYILYGENGTEKTYLTIYGIRVAFNTIYAFTDSEIRESAYAVAVAVFGVPPLTFLVPIAQAAIIIALSLAESGIDLAMLKAGMDVPLFKTSDTWTLKWSSIASGLTGEVIDIAAEQAKAAAVKAVDKGVQSLNGFLDKTEEEVDDWLNDKENDIKEISKNVVSGINESIERYTDAVMNQLVNICQIAETLTDASGKIDGVSEEEYIKNRMNEWLNAETEGIDAEKLKNDIGYIAKKEAISLIVSDNYYISAILTSTRESIQKSAGKASAELAVVSEELQEKLKRTRDTLVKTVTAQNEKIQSYISSSKSKVQEAATKGGEELKSVISDSINGMSNSLTEAPGENTSEITLNKDSNTAASFMSFSYSDYLRLFLVIGLTANQETILLRTADVVQTNVKLKDDDKTDFYMKSAYAYVTIEATLKVRPLMLTLPFMQGVTDGKLDGDGWYTIKYKGVQGY